MLLDFGRIAARAALLRQRCGFFDEEPPYSTVQLHRTCFPDVHVTGAPLPANILEMVQVGVGRRVLYFNREAGHPAQRVGIVHGLGHLLTDLRNPTDAEDRHCDRGARDLEAAGAMPPDPVEIACDLFAGEILVPFDRLDEYAPDALFPTEPRHLDAWEDERARLASRFNVPTWFIDWRLRDLWALRHTSFSLNRAHR